MEILQGNPVIKKKKKNLSIQELYKPDPHDYTIQIKSYINWHWVIAKDTAVIPVQ